ncbi:VOC family protein [Flavimaricola marinus]|uniref:Glyoxalase-like domain protein n=1 Tax=Flavimaricola marinus TaxID=1819565 RepID=A0A238LCM3_9RHOB|nr:VOC family protein [Flavimaricola marinus]SMY07439.1 Glyoxalase-like domain protein [Flavimaricola marinus]
MKLGAFSISLPVKDIVASMAFYKTLGFAPMGPVEEGAKWAILVNPDGHIIGLFEGMFDKPMLTFNPGWDQAAQNVDPFEDVRALHSQIAEHGVETTQVTLEGDAGPGSFVVIDPDGNPILIDQHR